MEHTQLLADVCLVCGFELRGGTNCRQRLAIRRLFYQIKNKQIKTNGL
jgi:outer membrane lipopolysaccharide assembly protein LptE/RlpB